MTQADQAIQRVAALSSSVPAVVVPMTGGRTRPTGLTDSLARRAAKLLYRATTDQKAEEASNTLKTFTGS